MAPDEVKEAAEELQEVTLDSQSPALETGSTADRESQDPFQSRNDHVEPEHPYEEYSSVQEPQDFIITLPVASDATDLPTHAPQDDHDGDFNEVSLDASRPSTPPVPLQEDVDQKPTPPLSETTDTTPATTEPSTSSATLPSPQIQPIVIDAGETTETDKVPALSPSLEPKSPVMPSPVKRRVSGATMLQQQVSMTRQRNLPPKDKEQEVRFPDFIFNVDLIRHPVVQKKHLLELEVMMAASKEADKRKAADREAAAIARGAVLASVLPAWETAILPNWRVVLREDANGRSLRKMWWDGTMPSRWRGRLWGLCIGNGLAVGKSAYASALGRARKLEEEGKYPREEMERTLRAIEETLPTLKVFQRDGGVMHQDLLDILLAYSVYDGRTPRYGDGLSFPAALLLFNMSPPEAFISLVNLVDRSFLKSFYHNVPEEMEAYYRIFDTLLADNMPKVYANFLAEDIRPKLYLRPWLSTAFVPFLPIDLATRLFDVFLLEGDSFFFRAALSILHILEPRLFNPVHSELEAVFRGEDKGATMVVRREKGSDEATVLVEEVYTEMGCVDDAVFGRLRELDWKEETWDRLVTRELPEAD